MLPGLSQVRSNNQQRTREMTVSRVSLAVLALAAGLAAQSAPCFETSLGANIGAGDDTVSYTRALGFTFPGPAGPVTTIDISSNGFVWLGTHLAHGTERRAR